MHLVYTILFFPVIALLFQLDFPLARLSSANAGVTRQL